MSVRSGDHGKLLHPNRFRAWVVNKNPESSPPGFLIEKRSMKNDVL
tara:strand:+ start:667 stop:804 length:138 start_codon:yes stop_codon:yes gene_type:complete